MSSRKRRALHILLTLAAAAGFFFLSKWAAVAVIFVSALLLAVYEYDLACRESRVLTLCDTVDRLLHGDTQISFEEYQETELSMLAAEIHKMTVRLREQNAALLREKSFSKEALEDISHQLRTPLTSVMLVLGLMRAPELTRKQRADYLGSLYALLERMKWLIETMLSLSRMEAEAVRFEQKPVSCMRLIQHAADTVAVTAELKGIALQTEIAGDPAFPGDFHYTAEALTNLLKNAIEHTPPGGSVRVFAEGSSICTRITVCDSGSGIPPQELPHIFERFYRSAEYTKNGYGIGLAFAKKVISMQNGSLRAENRREGGALFDIRFYHSGSLSDMQ